MNTAESLRARLANAPNIQAIARATGISGRQLYRIAKGVSTPNLKTAELIAAALDNPESAPPPEPIGTDGAPPVPTAEAAEQGA